MTRELALAHLTVETATPAEVVAAAAQAGFSGVGLRVTGFTPGQDHVGLIGDAPGRRALRSQLAGEGIRIVNVCAYRLTDRVRVEDYRPVINACAELGAGTILATCFIADLFRRSDLVAALAEAGSQAGIRIGLEFFRSSELRTLDAAEDLRRGTGLANVGHVIDALHLSRAGCGPADLGRLEPSTIYGLQLCDAPLPPPPDEALRDEIRNRLLPGDGELPLHALLRAVPARCDIEVEAPHRLSAALPRAEVARRAWLAGQSVLRAGSMAPARGEHP